MADTSGGIRVSSETAVGRLVASGNNETSVSSFELLITTNAPILESLLLQLPTDAILKLFHTSHYLRTFLRTYPTAWKYLSFRLAYPSGTQPQPQPRSVIAGLAGPLPPRQSRPYALDQLLMTVVVPLSLCLRSLELDNTAVSGQILVSTVLHPRRETLEHLSVRGCKNVSLRYHIVPYLTMFGLQQDFLNDEQSPGHLSDTRHLALKSLYTYRCRHHRRRPYPSSSLLRRDSDSEPTHELVKLCYKLGIWTDTAWCTTPAGRCFRRRGYVDMRSPQPTTEVWVVFDRLWRSKNWIGPVDGSHQPEFSGKVWEHEETGCFGEALGLGDGSELGEGKMTPAHLRRSHKLFIQNVRCTNCLEEISERCEQCSILMHCVGCRKTLCASCAFDRPYLRRQRGNSSDGLSRDRFWWPRGTLTSPGLMQDDVALDHSNNPQAAANAVPPAQYPNLKLRWCCTEPIFSGGGGISIGIPNRDVDNVRAVPLPRGHGWEDLECSVTEWSRNFPKYAYGDPKKPDYSLEAGHFAMMKWLLGPPNRQVSFCPRNLCPQCYESPQWKVHCKCCSRPLCIEHDLRGLRLRICGYRDLGLEKVAIQDLATSNPQNATDAFAVAGVDQTNADQRAQGTVDSAASSVTGDQIDEVMTDVNVSGLPAAVQEDERPSPSRRTSRVSTNNSNQSRSSSPSSVYLDSAVTTVKWQGCQSFFCPAYRPIGDLRQRCPSDLRECVNCSVYVCQDCVRQNPPCDCSFCESKYLCPRCIRASELCRRVEEERAKRERKWKEDMGMLQNILERRVADEFAEIAGQFFDQLDPNRPQMAQPGGLVAGTAAPSSSNDVLMTDMQVNNNTTGDESDVETL